VLTTENSFLGGAPFLLGERCDEREAVEDPLEVHDLAGEELGDGEGDDVCCCGDVGNDAADLLAGQAVGNGAEAKDDLVAVDGVDVEVDGYP
jgi:hypothetical protein